MTPRGQAKKECTGLCGLQPTTFWTELLLAGSGVFLLERLEGLLEEDQRVHEHVERKLVGFDEASHLESVVEGPDDLCRRSRADRWILDAARGPLLLD